MHYLQRPVTRRAFLTSILAAAGLGGIAAYGAEQWPLSAPTESPSPTFTLAPANGFAPLLLITDPAPRPDFTAYLGEILRAEGFLGLRQLSLRQLDHALDGAVVVLGPTPLNTESKGWLRQFVASGGGLVGIRPDPALAEVFGVRYLGVSQIDDALYPATHTGITGPLQLHTVYDRIDLRGAEPVATSSNGDPLVTIHRFGYGMAALWTFDLARTIALIRQGNPAWANQERDLMEGLRASDLFVGWIDLDRITIPQADEHQRLLSRMIEEVSPLPLPRLWYLPDNAPSAIIATGDAHGSRVSHIERLLAIIERHGGTASIYYTPPPASVTGRLARKLRWMLGRAPLIGPAIGGDDPLPGPHHVAAWRDRGHEFGMHPYVEEGLEEGYYRHWSEFLKLGYGPLPPTVRTHRILWHGWVDNAIVQARYGIRMNLDHYHSGPAVRKPDGTWTMGYLNGSGLPMRFVAADGTVIDVYQQATHLVDEHLMPVFQTGYDVGLNGTSAAEQTIRQIAASIDRYPAALGLQCHVDPFLLGEPIAGEVAHWLETTLGYAAGAKLPIIAAERWLRFIDARNAANLSDIAWNGQRLRGTISIPATPFPLSALLPERHRNARLRAVTLADGELATQRREIAGTSYRVIRLTSGQHQLIADYAL
ncbi:hypothetical protein [Chloroflexus sp.]|uniref:hypothetical protein n=1 Tax=Chloroflexus sp. TaxID=1904827 RepID=UPI002ACE0DA5|nr:hypothetical protein [Chloroflexus sp.]